VPDEIAPPATNPDAALLERIAAGSREAFECLVALHQDAVFRFARAITRVREDAEDVLQETFLAAYRSAAKYRGESSVRTWLLVIARNAAFRIGRKQLPTVELDETRTWDLGLMAGWGQRDPESLVIKAQQRERLSVALASLDPESREVIVLRDLEQLSGEETAQVLGLSLQAMKSRLHRARLKLAASLREGGLNDR
jgi:RNA polymerase sigma-70 factor, ECF subfamily